MSKKDRENDSIKPEGDVTLIDTDYQIGQDNLDYQIGPFSFDIHNRVFLISAIAVVLFVAITLLFKSQAEPVFTSTRNWLTSNLDWFFMLATNIFVILALVLIISPLGRVRIGGTEANPDFSYISWFAMLFAAGMGIGLMFYGVSEPLTHFTESFNGTAAAPLGGAEGDAAGARRLGMAATIYHWGLHPWATYAILALGLAIFSFNKGLPLTVRSIFYPILGERVWGWPGHIIDILAVLATLFGLATSLGFGASQASAGMNYLFNTPDGVGMQVFLVIGITIIALVSVMAGLDAGVKRLSEVNLALAALLMLFVIIVGPTLAIFTGFFDNIISYIKALPALSNPVGRTDTSYMHGWTTFYWAWWISWSPFVGMFIARVSRGRTVREFLIAVLLVPTLACILWMTVFGGTGITQYLGGFTDAATAALPVQLFEMLSELPIAQITSLIGIILVVVFFVTSSDSGSLVIDTIAAGGKVNAPTPQRVFWCTFEGLVAIVLMLGGGLVGLQAMAVSTGFPFAIVMLLSCIALVKGLLEEPRKKKGA
ncbi:BCCT transporter [Aliidiomarina taiwanensis]|uniref:BCCT transporter n=1 Tax=Aliidiomarina taiwanensis TaxID=946228 RepID=A0A432X886_9GAMM|nr:BCCT family transporter [Aliidiomarina taiwanensis]RUO43065.1 BCCT transporter [Aliidiomarina taiwanensis]